MSSPFDNYLESQVFSADPLQLVCLLYRGVLDSVEEARLHLASGDIFSRGRAITKASEILAELQTSLDHQKGGDLARSLDELYDYAQRRLNQAHIEQSEPPLQEVHRLLSTLLEGWKACEPSTRTVAGEAPEPSTPRLAVSY